jgi:hypothetical protein
LPEFDYVSQLIFNGRILLRLVGLQALPLSGIVNTISIPQLLYILCYISLRGFITLHIWTNFSYLPIVGLTVIAAGNRR